MKHSVLKGILHDFSNHIGLLLWYKKLGDFPQYKKTNVLERKDEFEKYCSTFLFERLPPDFDTTKITKYILEIIFKPKEIAMKFELNLDKQKVEYKTAYKK
jgi:hypothetical protein